MPTGRPWGHACTGGGTRTRRYHGLLIASADPPLGRRPLESLGLHLGDAGLGTVSEIFDGDPPHEPRACPAQAWSVTCTLEAWWKLERAQPKTQRGREDPS